MSLTERKAGGTSPDADDYNAVVDAVVALQAGGGGGGSQTLAQVLAEGADADGTGITNLGPTTLTAVADVASIAGPDAGAGDPADTVFKAGAAGDSGFAGAAFLRGGVAGVTADTAGAQFAAYGGSDDPEGSPAAGYAYMQAGGGGGGEIACAPAAANGGDGSVQITGEKLSFFGAPPGDPQVLARPSGDAGALWDILNAYGLVRAS